MEPQTSRDKIQETLTRQLKLREADFCRKQIAKLEKERKRIETRIAELRKDLIAATDDN